MDKGVKKDEDGNRMRISCRLLHGRFGSSPDLCVSVGLWERDCGGFFFSPPAK